MRWKKRPPRVIFKPLASREPFQGLRLGILLHEKGLGELSFFGERGLFPAQTGQPHHIRDAQVAEPLDLETVPGGINEPADFPVRGPELDDRVGVLPEAGIDTQTTVPVGEEHGRPVFDDERLPDPQFFLKLFHLQPGLARREHQRDLERTNPFEGRLRGFERVVLVVQQAAVEICEYCDLHGSLGT